MEGKKRPPEFLCGLDLDFPIAVFQDSSFRNPKISKIHKIKSKNLVGNSSKASKKLFFFQKYVFFEFFWILVGSHYPNCALIKNLKK